MDLQRQIREPYVTMRDGWVVTFRNPKPHQIRVDDIAWHLARCCRYNMHIWQWYSNAEHCILGTKYASSKQVARYFLTHDAAEYIYGDLTSPVKRLLPEYKKLIDEFQDFLWTLLCGAPITPEIAEEVHVIDLGITASEMRDHRKQPDSDLGCEPYANPGYRFWEWEAAYLQYTGTFRHYFPEWEDGKWTAQLPDAASLGA